MEMLQFIADLIKNLAWPITVIILIILLRKEISILLTSLTRVKYKDLEMDFKSLAESADKLPKSLTLITEDPVYTNIENQLINITEYAPSATILLAWSYVETALFTAVDRLAISPDPPSSRSSMHNLEQLKDYANLSQGAFDTINSMRILRNKIAHDDKQHFQVSIDEALTYSKTAFKIISYLNGLRRLN